MSQSESAGVIKRPFLKRGARMPVSRIPIDPTEACVQAIKNPPKKARDPAEFAPSDENEEPVVVARKIPSKSALSAKPQSVQIFAPPRPAALPSQKSQPRYSEPPSRPPQRAPKTPPPQMPPSESPKSSFSDPSFDFGLVSDSLDFSIPPPPLAAPSRAPVSVSVPVPVPSSRPSQPQPSSRPSTRIEAASLAPTPAVPSKAPAVSEYETQLLERSRVLDAEIARFKAENEKCRKLRVERERLLEETGRMQANLTVEREKFYEEKRQFELSLGRDGDRNERVKLLLRDLSLKDAEIKDLRDKVAVLETDVANKAKLHKADRDRLELRNKELETKVATLDHELKLACKSLLTQRTSAQPGGQPGQTGQAGRVPSPEHSARLPTGVVAGEAPTQPRQEASVIGRERMTDGREELFWSDGKKEVVFPSGLRKLFYADGSTSTIFQNGDKKEVTKEGATVYYYMKTGAKQTTYPNGLDVIEFATGQIERHFPDGSKEIIFANGAKKTIPAAASSAAAAHHNSR